MNPILYMDTPKNDGHLLLTQVTTLTDHCPTGADTGIHTLAKVNLFNGGANVVCFRQINVAMSTPLQSNLFVTLSLSPFPCLPTTSAPHLVHFIILELFSEKFKIKGGLALPSLAQNIFN